MAWGSWGVSVFHMRYRLKTVCQAGKGTIYHNSHYLDTKTGEKLRRQVWKRGMPGLSLHLRPSVCPGVAWFVFCP